MTWHSAEAGHVASDDDGTAYASLFYLKRRPVDEMKIDKGCVREIAEDATEKVIAISMGRWARTGAARRGRR